MKTLGVIGGTGPYDMPGLADGEQPAGATPFGRPSDDYVRGRLGDTQLVFLPRHGRGHRLLPTEINYRANLFGMKELGVEWLVSVAAVGSLRKEIEPGHLVVPDQFIDRTVARPSTFFGGGIVAHVTMADPVCPSVQDHSTVRPLARRSPFLGGGMGAHVTRAAPVCPILARVVLEGARA